MEKTLHIKIFLLSLFITISAFNNSNAFFGCFSEDTQAADEPLPPADKRLQIEHFDAAARLRCLSLDGGGVRGVYTAENLCKLDAELSGGMHICEVFAGGITGTSTGSFIALGLVAPSHKDESGQWQPGPYTPKDITEFYLEMGKKVFKSWTVANCMSNATSGYGEGCFAILKKTLWSATTCFGCLACYKNCGGLCGPKYSNVPLRKALEQKFGDLRLKDALVPVQVVAYDIELNRPRYFSSTETPEARFVDVAMCSSAAPTYFPAVSIDVQPGTGLAQAHCVDGGLFDNSPIIAALRFGIANYPKEVSVEVHWDDFVVLSIGTGEFKGTSRYKKLKHAGLLGWASSAVSIGINGTTQAAESNMDLLYAGVERRENYFRVQAILSPELSAMDNPRIMQKLINAARAEVLESDLIRFISHHIFISDEAPAAEAIAQRFDVLRHEMPVRRLTVAEL